MFCATKYIHIITYVYAKIYPKLDFYSNFYTQIVAFDILPKTFYNKAMEKTIMTECGQINFELKRTNSRKINIRIKQDGKVYVCASKYAKNCDIENAVIQHADWINRQCQIMRQKYCSQNSNVGREIYLLGKRYDIKFDNNYCGISLRDNNIIIGRDATLQHLAQSVSDFASRYFNERFEQQKSRLGITQNVHFRLANVKSWWGQYTPKNGCIKLSLRLIARSPLCIDAVICHEFAHITELNHQSNFYRVLRAYCPDYKIHQKALAHSKYYATDRLLLRR